MFSLKTFFNKYSYSQDILFFKFMDEVKNNVMVVYTCENLSTYLYIKFRPKIRIGEYTSDTRENEVLIVLSKMLFIIPMHGYCSRAFLQKNFQRVIA